MGEWGKVGQNAIGVYLGKPVGPCLQIVFWSETENFKGSVCPCDPWIFFVSKWMIYLEFDSLKLNFCFKCLFFNESGYHTHLTTQKIYRTVLASENFHWNVCYFKIHKKSTAILFRYGLYFKIAFLNKLVLFLYPKFRWVQIKHKISSVHPVNAKSSHLSLLKAGRWH